MVYVLPLYTFQENEYMNEVKRSKKAAVFQQQQLRNQLE